MAPGGCPPVRFQGIDALTLRTADMARSVAFYTSIGLRVRHGGPEADFTTFELGRSWLNLQAGGVEPAPAGWGRAVVFVDDVDALYRQCVELAADVEAPPRDAPWGERYFHVRDPDGHELSFAHPLDPGGGMGSKGHG